MITDLFFITLTVCFIIDCSGFIESLKRGLVKTILRKNIQVNFRMKPFDCSLCMTFWCGMIYLWFRGEFTCLSIACVCLLAYFTTSVTQLLYVLQDIFGNILNRISDKIERYDNKE